MFGPAPMYHVSLPVFFRGSVSFNLEEHVEGMCNLLQLTTPNSLTLICVLTSDGVSEAALDTMRRVLCPALLACDSLRHIGLRTEGGRLSTPPDTLIQFVDDIFSSTPSCHSLFVDVLLVDDLLQKHMGHVLHKRTAAHVKDARFQHITRIAMWKPELLGVEVVRSLRVVDCQLRVAPEFFESPGNLPEYLSLSLRDESVAVLLFAALSSPGSSLRGLKLDAFYDIPPTIAENFGDAIGFSQLEELSMDGSMCQEVLDAFVEGVSRSQLRFVRFYCGRKAAVEAALMKVLTCFSLRELLMPREVWIPRLSEQVQGLLREHPNLEYCQIGAFRRRDESYGRWCDRNLARSMVELIVLLLQWVGSFTELSIVDINLVRLIRMLMVMPTDQLLYHY